MASNDREECIGSGGAPMVRTEQREREGKTSGVCPACSTRLTLDSHGLIPAHDYIPPDERKRLGL